MHFFITSLLLMGGVGFFAGFIGPIILSPDANQGPLLGIFITGPLGAVAGAVLGLVLPLFSKGMGKFHALGAFAVGELVVILFLCLPDPKFVGTLYMGTIAAEESPGTLVAAAVKGWEEQARKYSYYTPRTNWQREMATSVRDSGGRVVTINVSRSWEVSQNRKPWSKGTYLFKPKPETGATRAYVAKGVSIAPAGYYLSTFSMPKEDWPPRGIANFLGMVEIVTPPDDMAAGVK